MGGAWAKLKWLYGASFGGDPEEGVWGEVGVSPLIFSRGVVTYDGDGDGEWDNDSDGDQIVFIDIQ